MKVITVLLLLLLTSPVFGELTMEDLRTVIKEENTASEKRMKEYIDLKVDGLDEKLSARIDGLDKRMGNMRLFMIALVGLIAAAIAIPQIIIAYRDREQRELRAEVEQLRQTVEAIQNTSV